LIKSNEREWLETDGLGGFASGTVSGRRTRRYHALLLASVPENQARFVLVNGLEVYVHMGAERRALSSQLYLPNVIHPHGDRFIHDFQSDPWPTWDFHLESGVRIRQEFFVPHGFSGIVIKWSLIEPVHQGLTLTVRPLLSGRNYHALHHANDVFRFDHQGDARHLVWAPYPGVPRIHALTTGTYQADPLWFYRFYYPLEEERGLDDSEDLASPGVFRFELRSEAAILMLSASGERQLQLADDDSVQLLARRLERNERVRRIRFSSRLHRSANQFLIRSGDRETIIAGYPWFTDWGRDSFIACRGLCLATGDVARAGRILSDWANTVSRGMLPNRFPDGSNTPEYNSVDASLWFVIAVHDYLEAMRKTGQTLTSQERDRLLNTVEAILQGYSRGTRFGIRADEEDGLLRAGEPGQQLTWMDARVDGCVITPRIGKPVEIQALWIHALETGSQFDPRWRSLEQQARESFGNRFWNAEKDCLFDVIDVDHQRDVMDSRIRPNQIFAVGGLPHCLLSPQQARSVVKRVETELVTPGGLRTLSPEDPDYHPHYRGNPRARDEAYHQGTAWPWLMGPFIEAWLRVHGETAENRTMARTRFVQPLLNHLDDAGLGHLSEIMDGETTSTSEGTRQIPRGCPFQAWSLGELLRLLEGPLSSPESPDSGE